MWKMRMFTAVAVLSAILPTAYGAEAQILRGQPTTLLEVRAKGLKPLDERAKKVRDLPHVTKVERYLLVKTQPHDVIGIEPGSPLRIITRDDRMIEGKLVAGRSFREGEFQERFAVVGRIYAEDYGFRGTMRGMVHFFDIGQTFILKKGAKRVRVIGGFSAEPTSEADKVFLPLTTTQGLFGLEGKVTHFFVTVDAPANAERVAQEIVKLRAGMGEEVEVIAR